MRKFILAVAAIFLVSANAAPALTLDPTPTSTAPLFGYDWIVVESSGNRPKSTGDVGGEGLDVGTIAAGQNVGLAGRIVTASDTWRFTALSPWTMAFVNLDLDDNQGFDSSNIDSAFGKFAKNGDTTMAKFSLLDGDGNPLSSVNHTANAGGFIAELFSGDAGTFSLLIDGMPKSRGATYDIGVSVAAVPLPGTLPLLAAGIGGLLALRRRKAA
jgi:hypothetical protein